MKTYAVKLTYDELKLLDGQVSDEAQKVIERAKAENGFGLDDKSNEIIADALKKGTLTWCSVTISECTCCKDKPRGYHKYTRDGKWHRKGDLNHDRPFRYYGVQPNAGFVILEGASGICTDCWKNVYLPKIGTYIVENNLPIQIQENNVVSSRYKKDPIRICGQCGERIRESEMGRTATLLGRGSYPSTCPKCGAEATFLGKISHERTDDFVMIPIDLDERSNENDG